MRWSLAYRRDSPREIASSPADCGARSRRSVSAPRTIRASADNAGPCSSTRAARHRRWHIEEFGGRIDEPAHQPGTGDAVDLGALARDPARGAFAGDPQVLAFAQARQSSLRPALEPALQVTCVPAGFAQLGRGLLADLQSVHAVHDHLAGPAARGEAADLVGRA